MQISEDFRFLFRFREVVLVSEDLEVHALLIRLGRSSVLRRIFVLAQ